MTEGFRSPPTSVSPGFKGTAATRQEVVDTVQRIMGDDIAATDHPGMMPAPAPAGHSSGIDDASTNEIAKQQAADVADTARQAGTQVADTVKEQAGQVTAEAKNQAKELIAQAQSELTDQAGATQQRISEGLQALADELSGMARNSEQDGLATDLARQAADKARQTAEWLADRDPGSLMDEVRTFARKKPGTYLAIALGAGVLAGRLTRGLTASGEDNDPSPDGRSPRQVGIHRPAVGGDQLTIGTGYAVDPVIPPSPPVTDPSLLDLPVAGNGDSGLIGGPRGGLAP